MKKILLILGTRPECIKLAPVYEVLSQSDYLSAEVCVTGQQQELLNQALELFGMKPDHDLVVMTANQTLEDVTAKVLIGVTRVLKISKPDLVLVHGDTTTSFAASLASFYQKVPVGHVEAGLRTDTIYAPWPEELNRRLTSKVAAIHFAPTKIAAKNLIAEGVNASAVVVTGNTVIDSLLKVVKTLQDLPSLASSGKSIIDQIPQGKKILLVTGHRRENFGEGFESICKALIELAMNEDLHVVYSMHLNPNVMNIVTKRLGGLKNISLVEPQDYHSFIYLMLNCHIILTDSGGVQEEAPSLGKPVLVMRDTTERPEGVQAGTVLLVGSNQQRIVKSVNSLLDDEDRYHKMAVTKNPYGDGLASQKIFEALMLYFNKARRGN